MNRQLQKVHSLPSQLLDQNGNYELAYQKLASLKEFSGNYLAEHHPAKYRMIVHMIGEMLPAKLIAIAAEVSPLSVEAVRIREKIPIEHEKEALLSTVRAGTRVCAERVLELAPTMNAKESAIAFGILAEKQLLLSGEPTMIVGKEDSVKHATFNDLINGLPQAHVNLVVDGKSGETDPPLILEGETGPIGAAAIQNEEEANIDETSTETTEKKTKISSGLSETRRPRRKSYSSKGGRGSKNGG